MSTENKFDHVELAEGVVTVCNFNGVVSIEIGDGEVCIESILSTEDITKLVEFLKGGWIKVTPKTMPKDRERVQIYLPDYAPGGKFHKPGEACDPEPIQFGSWFECLKQWRIWGWNRSENVTLWKPVPCPPK